VGLVFQDPSTQLVMDRVEDDVAFGLENRDWSPPEMHERVPDVLAQMGLSDRARTRIATLSGGEEQRVALAGVVAPRPAVLVLDEPTANLDPTGARKFIRELAAVRAERSATIVLIEHRVDLVWDLADLLLVLGRDGRPIEFGPPAAVVERSARRIADAGVWLPRAIEDGLGERPPRMVSQAPKTATSQRVAAVTATHVDYAYGRGAPVVQDASLVVHPGDRVALVGPNGSGKSTLGRLLVGLLKPLRGTIALFGDPPHHLPAAVLARRAGYVFQDPEAQFLADTVAEEINVGLSDDERAHVPELMMHLRLPLEEFGTRSPYALSGGEQRRLSLACCLVRSPRFVVLDEPTFGQDRSGHGALLEILRARVDAGAAVMAATHDERFVAEFAEQIVTLDRGHITSVAEAPGMSASQP
jgi:energy-coupling factor transporter ATP-binding protein EcfA2